MDITESQREILNELVNGYERREEPVPAPDLADATDRHVGTIRGLMQLLKSIDLVEGVAGPDGGYVPTETAFETLDRRRGDDGETLGLAHEYERADVAVEEVRFTAVHHPDKCVATVTLRESVGRFGVGDPVVVGPTPMAGLAIAGAVEAVDEGRNELRLAVGRLEAPLRE